MILLLSGFVGALVGASTTFFFNMWKFHRDERSSRCDELCKAVVEASDQASEYWVKDFADDALGQSIAEARLLAAQTTIDGIFADFRPFLRLKDDEALDARFVELFDLLTGGDFSVPGRVADLGRTTRVLPAARDISVQIRRAHRDTVPFQNLSRAYHQNRRRKMDMPLGWRGGT